MFILFYAFCSNTNNEPSAFVENTQTFTRFWGLPVFDSTQDQIWNQKNPAAAVGEQKVFRNFTLLHYFGLHDTKPDWNWGNCSFRNWRKTTEIMSLLTPKYTLDFSKYYVTPGNITRVDWWYSAFRVSLHHSMDFWHRNVMLWPVPSWEKILTVVQQPKLIAKHC